MTRLTVVNDNPDLLGVIGEILDGDRYVTTLIGSPQGDVVEQICRSEPDLLMIDLRHGNDPRHGWDIVQQLRRTSGCGTIPVILCSADFAALSELEPELEHVPGVAALKLPFGIDDLLQSIGKLIDSRGAFRCS
jgi:CheY-like chemotaxis protein